MRLAPNGEIKARETMRGNMITVKKNSYLSKEKKAAILKESFWNYLLRFMIINGRKYPTNSMMHVRGELFLKYTNPHEKNIRVSYDHARQTIFIEKMQLVSHPFIGMQRIVGDDVMGVMMCGYQACGFTDPNEKVQQWTRFGDEIPISRIKSIKIESFWDRPRAIWNNWEDYTAFKMTITTK